MSAGDERRARWARWAKQASRPQPSEPSESPAKAKCDGCQKPEPLVAVKDGVGIVCRACADAKAPEPPAEPRMVEVEIIKGSAAEIGYFSALHTGNPVRVDASADDDVVELVTGIVVGFRRETDGTVTFWLREVLPP